MTLGSRSRVSGNVSHGGIRTNRLWLLDLHTEFALDPRLVSNCFQGNLDTTSTQLSAGAHPFRVLSPSLSGGMARGAKSSIPAVRIARVVLSEGRNCYDQKQNNYAGVTQR